MKLYSQLLEILAEHGVGQIFGVPGDAINPLIEAIRLQDKIQFIHVIHEEAGAIAASAQAKLSGKLAVCAGTVGPGAIHLLNGLYDAKKDHAPVLAITGQVPSIEMGFEYHQEVDIDALFDDVAVYQQTIQTPDQMPRIGIEACNMALYKRGVAVLTIPHDVGNKNVSAEKWNGSSINDFNIVPTQPQLEYTVDLINKAEKISILFGEGCRNCSTELVTLSQYLAAPLVFSLKGKDIVPYTHEQIGGNVGLLGSRGGVAAMEDCDLLLNLGSDFPYRDWYPEGVPVIHVDIDPTAIGRRVGHEIGLIGDCKTVIELLLQEVKHKSNQHHIEKVRKVKALWDKAMVYSEDVNRSKDMIHPQALAKLIGDLANDDAIFTCDTGAVTVWGARHITMKEKQRFTCSFNLASMAYAMPAALGAKLRYPNRQVISLSGDGGFNMLMGDFLTAVKYKLPIKVFIFNNRKLGLIKMEQEVEGYPEHETDLHNPDYALLAKSFGAEGSSVSDPKALKTAIELALATPGPYLLDVRINPDEITMPPKLELAQAWGFSKAKVKEIMQVFLED